MVTETIIGFDSAWANKAPGAICSITMKNGQISGFRFPQPASFDDALALTRDVVVESDFTLIAIDQPTLVPNTSGCRPVERVAGSIVNAIGGGVQPANRSKTSMFGSDAPIWNFLDQVNARENPAVARLASHGEFLIEVFPALALPSIIPEIWFRRRAAKYNPVGRKYYTQDWQLVTSGVERASRAMGLHPVASAANFLGGLEKPTKADQDNLDALICLMVGFIFRRRPPEETAVIGDRDNGYIVTPVTSETMDVLVRSAALRNVPMNVAWSRDAVRVPSALQLARPGYLPYPAGEVGKADDGRDLSVQKRCPVCGHLFRGKGWSGIDAHWKALHEDLMPYAEAWEAIAAGRKIIPSQPDN
ncbi:DUF429 domain-containing protein [Psychromarinibacter halotolerans]|uniref:DUF429 domain-containing protein n=1 Tax=Psychromarinibacter halotolerans TaxID=1775175 RepID=A0ABV7GYF5_9RHOB|nr:DUF429 domain-containing protein [Psychromarinibacter halotolerans]MDF0598387.1 DUF429 domain-containing protein [Psychromarinibacter halotolerans]